MCFGRCRGSGRCRLLRAELDVEVPGLVRPVDRRRRAPPADDGARRSCVPARHSDFFRVVDVDPKRHRLLLQAEMKVPGTAWLGWAVDDTEEGTRLIQSARFIPVA